MALLQISEPGQWLDPHQRRVALGIDLGTTHSLVALVRDGLPQCLPDAQGRVMLPSVVHYASGGEVCTGAQALAQADPLNTVVSAKRLMGRSLDDVRASCGEALPWRLVADDPARGMVRVCTCAGEKSPVQVSAELLRALRQRAQAALGCDVDAAVITVPAYFDDAQRQATRDAAQLAGLQVLRLINEPTAAAMAYGLDNASEGVYAVFDLGGGTFDVSILRLTQGVFEVIATGGDAALGGDDYDRALAAWVQRCSGVAITDAADRAALLQAARACKHALSQAPQALCRVPLRHAPAIEQRVSRADFEALSAHLTQRCIQVAQRTLHDAQLVAADVQGVVMVGGSTRMPMVQQAAQAVFGKPPLTNLDAEEVVALGAAIQADALVGNAHAGRDVLLLDVTALSLGVETMGGLVERIIPRNQGIPVAMAQDFTTHQDGQTAMSLHVVQGERDLAADCRSLARFSLRGIPPMAAGAARVRVTFTVDADGLLSVSAQEQSSGAQAQVQTRPSYGLGDEDIARMLQEGFAHASLDMAQRALAQARLDAQRLWQATHSALHADGDLLQAPARSAIQALMQDVQNRLQENAHGAEIEKATRALAQGTEAFAALRMNRSIAQALTGQRFDAL